MNSEQEKRTIELGTFGLLDDGPIELPKQDLLGRMPFAVDLAHALEGIEDDRPLVVAVTGKWGSGKTSLMNLVAHVMEEGASPVVRFNPWQFVDVEHLVRELFASLEKGVRGTSEIRQMQEVEDLLETVGELAGLLPQTWFSKLLALLAKLLGRASSIERARSRLKNAFKKLERRIVILVDDLDRLEPKNLRLVLQVLRMNADLPNVTYLLSFDRQVVERCVRAPEYLHKIVQVFYDLPVAPPETIHQYLLAELNRLLEQAHWTEEVNEKRFLGHTVESQSQPALPDDPSGGAGFVPPRALQSM